MAKSIKNIWQDVVDWENLQLSFKQAKKGKKYYFEVLEYKKYLEDNIYNTQQELLEKTWAPDHFRQFWVYDQKSRLIQAPPFKDRVVHHALVNKIQGHLENKFIFDSFACRKGKGIHAATNRVQSFLQTSKYNYVLKADIRKYFPSVNNKILLSILSKNIKDKDVLWLCEAILSSHEGLPVGALTSQLWANVYLNELDHFIKDELGVCYFVRYMDDFVILGQSKKELWDLLSKINTFITCNLDLTLNPKTDVFPVSKGIDFCGYRTWSTHMLPRKKTVKRARRKFKKLNKWYAEYRIDLDYVKPRVMSFLGYMWHCDSYTSLNNTLGNLVLQRGSN